MNYPLGAGMFANLAKWTIIWKVKDMQVFGVLITSL